MVSHYLFKIASASEILPKKGGGDTQFHSGAIPLNYLVLQRKEIQIVLT